MFIENEITYKDCQDYAKKNDALIWHGEDDNLKAMNGNYLITVTKSRGVWASAGRLTGAFDSVDEAKLAAEKHYAKYDWKRSRLI